MKWIMFLMFGMEVPPIELKTYKTKDGCLSDLRKIHGEKMVMTNTRNIKVLENPQQIAYVCLPVPK